MNLTSLREKQAEYLEKIKPDLDKDFQKLENKRLKFIKLFPAEKISEITLDEYVVGGGRKNSFCYWLETNLMDFGKIKGGSTAPNKFGVYFGRTKSDSVDKFRTIGKWGDSIEEAFEKVRSEIVSLLKAGNSHDIEAIIQNNLSPMFKGKILATYFPNKYLSIFSDDHLNHYINTFNLSFQNYRILSPVEKRDLLINELKNKDEIMKDWSLYDFSSFLWNQFSPPRNKKSENFPSQLKQYQDSVYPDLFEVSPEVVDVEFKTIPEINQTKKSSTNTKYKPDYEILNKNKRVQGEKAEIYVLKFEKEYLTKLHRENLVLKIKQMSLVDDSVGYDIISFDENGNEKQIEVKSNATVLKNKISFFITANEYEKAKNLSNYWIYYVTELKSLSPKIVKINITDQLEKMELIPSQYKATFYIKD